MVLGVWVVESLLKRSQPVLPWPRSPPAGSFWGDCGFILEAAATGGTSCAGGAGSREVHGTCPRGVTSTLPHGCSPQPPQNSHSVSTIPSVFVRVAQEHLLCPQIATPCPEGFQGWDLHSQPRSALSTDPPTCLCQLMELIFTSFHLENRRQKSSNNFPGSRSLEEVSVARSRPVMVRAAQGRVALARGAERHPGTPVGPDPHSAGHWDMQWGQTSPTLGIASPHPPLCMPWER